LDIGEREIVAVLGLNGAGKSTLMKIIVDLVRPSGGEVKLFGMAPGDPTWKQDVGYLPESFRVSDTFSGEGFLRYVGKLREISELHLDERVGQTLGVMGLSEWKHRRVSEYSKGMMIRLGMAQAALHRPRLLVLDEPTEGLDPLGRQAVLCLLRSTRDKGGSILLSSHIVSEVEMIADRVLILEQGKIGAVVSPEELQARELEYHITVQNPPQKPVTAEAFQAEKKWCLRVKGSRHLEPVLAELREEGIRVLSVVPVRDSLEQLFLSHSTR
jgi:ABC-2 type transport system ATP-binding protein